MPKVKVGEGWIYQIKDSRCCGFIPLPEGGRRFLRSKTREALIPRYERALREIGPSRFSVRALAFSWQVAAEQSSKASPENETGHVESGKSELAKSLAITNVITNTVTNAVSGLSVTPSPYPYPYPNSKYTASGVPQLEVNHAG